MNENLRKDAIIRALRLQNQEKGRKVQKDKTTVRPEPKTEEKKKKLYVEELPQIVLSADHESQIGESNLEEGDVVVYLRAVVFKPEVFKNISKRGKNAVRDYATQQPAYFLITRETCAGDVLKALLQASINPPKQEKD